MNFGLFIEYINSLLSREKIVETITSLLLAFFAYLNYRVVKESYEPVASINLKQINDGIPQHFQLIINNHSKVEIESLVNIKIKTEKEFFEVGEFDYGGKSLWILHPFMQKTGHFELKNLRSSNGDYIKELGKLKSIKILVYLRYRKPHKKIWKKWKKLPRLDWTYNFKNNAFYPENKPKP